MNREPHCHSCGGYNESMWVTGTREGNGDCDADTGKEAKDADHGKIPDVWGCLCGGPQFLR